MGKQSGPDLPPAELATRHVPWTRQEFAWAHDRPSKHRTRCPAVGDTVLYRHVDWADPVEAQVVWVQPLDDVDDPHIAEVSTDHLDRPLLLEGRAVMALRRDPWRRLHLKTPYGVVDTREARLRGSPGWLPLDWRARYRPTPDPSPVPVLGAVPLLDPGAGVALPAPAEPTEG